jgi:D-alanine transaminase
LFTVYWNGEYMPLDKAMVPVEDRGFLFGDGIYEVVRYYGGRGFYLDIHLQRLQHSAEGSRLPLAPGVAELPAIIDHLLAANDLQDVNIYIQCTRGAVHPRSHAFPEQPNPTLLVMPVNLNLVPANLRANGVPAITVPDERWGRCDIKSIMLLPNVLAKEAAHDAGAFEAIFIRDSLVTEGSSTNTFAVIEGCVFTHPDDHHILGGVTRDVTLRLARQLGLPVREEPFTLDEMYGAKEVFLTSTTSEVLAITQIDGRTVGNGRPGAITQRLYEAFHKVTAL